MFLCFQVSLINGNPWRRGVADEIGRTSDMRGNNSISEIHKNTIYIYFVNIILSILKSFKRTSVDKLMKRNNLKNIFQQQIMMKSPLW